MDDVAASACDTVTPSRIDALLAGMREQGGQRFDAAGWHYLETLAQRAAAHEGSVRRMLELKLQRAAELFAERFAQSRSAAAGLLAATGEQHPQAVSEMEQLFASGDFRGLRYLVATLAARGQAAVLTGLASQFEPGRPGASEQAVVQAAAAHATAAQYPALELKTVRESRATWARLSVDKQLAQAMKQGPKNAGPINSHMLVLRSLALMQEISPDYLSRFVSYADTLLMLEPGVVDVPAKRKKAVASKVAKPGKAAKK